MSNKVGIIYWSQSGNTAAMAEGIAEGAREAGAEVEVLEVGAADADTALSYDVLALGCPSMGAEALEEGEFEPFYDEIEPKLGGRKVALFGSYGWGDGQWMRDWFERATNASLTLVQDEGLIVNETPDEDGLELCRELGKKLATV